MLCCVVTSLKLKILTPVHTRVKADRTMSYSVAAVSDRSQMIRFLLTEKWKDSVAYEKSYIIGNRKTWNQSSMMYLFFTAETKVILITFITIVCIRMLVVFEHMGNHVPCKFCCVHVFVSVYLYV